jgi:hypothetical protein
MIQVCIPDLQQCDPECNLDGGYDWLTCKQPGDDTGTMANDLSFLLSLIFSMTRLWPFDVRLVGW